MEIVNNNVLSIVTVFKELINGSTHEPLGVCGTNNIIRAKIWEDFRVAYPTILNIKIGVVTLSLTANQSVSGKSTTYFSVISNEQYIALGNGSSFGLSKKKTPYISICSGIITVYGGGNYYFKIENSKLEIL